MVEKDNTWYWNILFETHKVSTYIAFQWFKRQNSAPLIKSLGQKFYQIETNNFGCSPHFWAVSCAITILVTLLVENHPSGKRNLSPSNGKYLHAEMKKYLYLLLGKVDGLFCILITDRDGVPILDVSTNKALDCAMRPSFISTFGKATDQGSKLGLGKNKLVISIYTSHQVVQINKLPMVVTFIASKESNTGQILSLEEHLDPLLNDLKSAIIEP